MAKSVTSKPGGGRGPDEGPSARREATVVKGLWRAPRLIYYEPDLQPPNPTLGALASLIDIHIYRSEAKDPADVVRVEVRLRGGLPR